MPIELDLFLSDHAVMTAIKRLGKKTTYGYYVLVVDGHLMDTAVRIKQKLYDAGILVRVTVDNELKDAHWRLLLIDTKQVVFSAVEVPF